MLIKCKNSNTRGDKCIMKLIILISIHTHTHTHTQMLMMIELFTRKSKKKCIRILLKIMILISKLYTHMNNIKIKIYYKWIGDKA